MAEDEIAYRTELSDDTQVMFFRSGTVELRQGVGQSVHFNVDDVDQLIDELITIRDEEF